MKRALFLGLLVAGIARAPGWASEEARPADAYDLIFLGEARPVLLRLHVRIDGVPLRTAWDQFTENLFRYLDRNGDGLLSEEELRRLPQPQLLLQLLRGIPTEMRAAPSRSAPEVEVSLVPGKVTREGLRGYYQQKGIEPFTALIQDKTTQAEALTDILFKGLDVNQDGKLSREELLAAGSSLRVLDLNNDELISIPELLPNADANDGRQMQREALKPLSNLTPFVLLAPDDSPTRLAYLLLGRYDKNQNQTLSRTEIQLDRHHFEQLDVNHDGELDAEELGRFLEGYSADVELIVQLSAAEGPVVDIYDPARHALTQDKPGAQAPSKPIAIRLQEARLAVQLGERPAGAFTAARQFLLEQFETADTEKRGHLETKQIQANSYLAALFPKLNGEIEQKLTKGEFTTLVDLLTRAVAGSVVLTITDEGHGLFEMLNSHHDGRLRQRELKLAWPRLAVWDRDGDGFIGRNEIPHQFHLRLSQGSASESLQLADGLMIPLGAVERKVAETSKGPLWFQRMDRNGDGEVSLREWLGSKEDFERFDTNHDGILSAEEAERADAELRKGRAAEEQGGPEPSATRDQKSRN